MKNLLGFSSSTLAIAIINVFSIMVLTRLFPPEDYGNANLIISYSTVLSTIMIISTDQVIMHYYYEASIKSILKNAQYFVLATIIIVLVLGFMSASAINLSLSEILIIIGYSLALAFNKIYMTLYRMERLPKHYFLQGFGVKFLELLLIIFLALSFGREYYYIVTPFIISVLIVNILQYFNIKSIIKVSDKKYPDINPKQQFSFAIPIMITILVTTMLRNIDKFIVNYYVSALDLGIYYASFRIVGLITIFYTLMALIWTPLAIKKSHADENYAIFINDSIKFNQYLALWLLLLFMLFDDMIILVLGTSYSEAIPLVSLLIGMPLFMLISEPYSTYITTSKKTFYHVRISLFAFLICIIITWILSQSFGIVGASHSILLTYFFLYLLRRFAAKKIKKNIKYNNMEIWISLVILSLILIDYHEDSMSISIYLTLISIIVLSLLYYKNFIRIIREIKEN